jgi:hypothetical protein
MLNARVTSPDITSSAARSVAPTMCAAASCMPGTIGTSSVPRPNLRNSSAAPARGRRFTASTKTGVCTLRISSSVASACGDERDRVVEQVQAADQLECQLEPRGFSGCVGVKRYSASASSHTSAVCGSASSPAAAGVMMVTPVRGRCARTGIPVTARPCATERRIPCASGHVLVGRRSPLRIRSRATAFRRGSRPCAARVRSRMRVIHLEMHDRDAVLIPFSGGTTMPVMLMRFSMPIRRTTRASSPGRFGICTSTRLDIARAAEQLGECTQQVRLGEDADESIVFEHRQAADVVGVEELCRVVDRCVRLHRDDSVIISSPTRRVCSACVSSSCSSAQIGGMARRRSRSVTIPTRRSSSRTGRCRIRCCA